MNLQTEKLSLIEWIAKFDDSSVIEQLRKIQEVHSQGPGERMKKGELASIERGLKDIKEGNVHPHESARKVYEKYL